MKRRTVHALFGAAAAACAAAALLQGLALQRTRALNRDIAAAAQAPVGGDAAAPAPRDAPREVRLARAVALAQAGAYDAAFKTYSGLVQQDGALDGIGRQAQFNLGNMYLRQAAVQGGSAQAGQAQPLVELAKQRYRDLLRAAPGDWGARYNLERALRLAPEEQEALAESENLPVERRRVMLRGMDPGQLP